MARSILITGSSHGIGAGCAIAFARDEQANIGICGNKNPEGAQEIARQCEAYGSRTKIYMGDVGSHDFCKEIMEDFIRTFVDSGDITKDESEKMCKLLDRYSKFR